MAEQEKNPLFTVIIPAKDRAEFLHHTLRTCTIQDCERLEIIVSDDGSSDNTREVVEEAARKDQRIRYVTPGAGVGMRENFEFALNQVKPGFVIALGADDGLLPYGIRDMRDLLLETGQELLAWPGPVFSYAGARTETGQLGLYRQSGHRTVQSKNFLNRQARDLHYLSDVESPMFYVKGVCSTRLVERVKSRSPEGRFYTCPTPDGYSGIVLAGEVNNYAFSGRPFSIYGISPSSQGLGYLTNDHQALRRSENFFRDISSTCMHKQLASQPYSPLISLMTADYILSIQDLENWPGSFPAIDFTDLLLKSLKELAHGLYAEERISRELCILNNIANQHGLGDFFRTKVKQMRRFQNKSPFEGNGISPSMVFFDCNLYRIFNILDASYFAYYFHQLTERTTASVLTTALLNSVKYKLNSTRMGGPFPDETKWNRVIT